MSAKSRLELFFGNQSSPGLYRTVFHAPGGGKPTVGMRGTTIPTCGLPFVWGPASQSLALLFVAAVRKHHLGESLDYPLLEGPTSSPAGALARLLKKRTASWLHDLFSSDASGRSLIHRFIILGNPRGKQHGPLSATLRTDYLSPSDIKVYLDGKDITSDETALTSLYEALTAAFIPRKDPLARHREREGTSSQILTSTACGYVLTAEPDA